MEAPELNHPLERADERSRVGIPSAVDVIDSHYHHRLICPHHLSYTKEAGKYPFFLVHESAK